MIVSFEAVGAYSIDDGFFAHLALVAGLALEDGTVLVDYTLVAALADELLVCVLADLAGYG